MPIKYTNLVNNDPELETMRFAMTASVLADTGGPPIPVRRETAHRAHSDPDFQTRILSLLRVTALLLGLGAVCLETHAEIYPWSKVVDSERIKIWRRESPTSSIKDG